MNPANDNDRAAVEGRIQTEFDVMFCGHVHRASPEFHKTTAGEAVLSQGGCLYATRDYFNGFNIVRLRLTDSKIEFALQEYSDVRRAFIPAERIVDGGSIEFPFPSRALGTASTLPAILWRVKSAIRRLANEHISISGASISAQRDIETHFVCPPLASRWEAAASTGDGRSQDDGREFETIDKIIKGPRNVMLLGRPEAGKTSLAHYVAVKCANGLVDAPRLPLMGRFADVRRGSNMLWHLAKDYAAEISDGTITRLTVEAEPSLLIVDDVDLFDEEGLQILNELVESSPRNRWVLFAQVPVTVSPEASAAAKLPSFDIHTIYELSRGSIRTLSAQWLSATKESDETDALFRSVMEHIERTGLPRSGYIVSLVLWALRNRSRGELLNEAVLLQNIIDYMLGRMDYTGALRGEFDFTSKSVVLQNIAFHFKKNDDVVTKNEIVEYLIRFLNKKGLRYDAAEIIRSFVECGILHQIQDKISFRYKRFQEFFVAGYMRDNLKDLETILKGDGWLDYRREIDIFSSRFRHEEWLLGVGLEKMKENAFPSPKLEGKALSEYLQSGPQPDYTQTQLRRMRTEPLTAEKIDEVIDRTERGLVRRRKDLQAEPAEARFKRDLATIRAYSAVELHSQLVRNLEFVDRDVKRQHLKTALMAWETMLRGWMSAFRDVMNEVREDVEEISDPAQPAKNAEPSSTGRGKPKLPITGNVVLKIIDFVEAAIKSFLPTILASTAYHHLASEKLVDLIDEIAAEMPVDSLGRMLFTFVLLEIDLDRALSRLLEDKKKLEDVRWMTAAVTQRLYAYYRSRPVPAKIRPKFEELVTDLDLSLQGASGSRGRRGRLLQRLKKQAYKETATIDHDR